MTPTHLSDPFYRNATFTPSALYWIMKDLRSMSIPFDFWAKNMVTLVILS